MTQIKTVSQESVVKEIKALLIFDFLDLYNQFEKNIKKVFQSEVKNFSKEVLQQLYFLYGGRIGTYIEYTEPMIKLREIAYNEHEAFKDLSVNQIFKLSKEKHFIPMFDSAMQSIQSPRTQISFIDSCIKLLKMRNKLAHEMNELSFKDCDLIELLSIDNIRNAEIPLLKNYDIGNIDGMSAYIASNIIYMRRMNNMMNDHLKEDSLTTQ